MARGLDWADMDASATATRAVAHARLGHAFSSHGLAGNVGWAVAPIFMAGIAAFAGWRTAALAAGAVALIALSAVVLLSGLLAAPPAPPVHAEEKPASPLA